MAPTSEPIYRKSSGSIGVLGTPTSSDTITNTVFGLCAIIIGALTVWQGRKVWRIWYSPRSTSLIPPGGKHNPHEPLGH